MKDRRSLAYKDRWLDYEISHIDEDTTGDSVSNELQIPFDEKTSLILTVTGEEYGKLFAALSLGVDLSYADEADQLKWLFWRAAKTMTFCDGVADCLLNSANVQAALLLLLANGQQNGGAGNVNQPLEQTVLGEDWLDGIGCDNDVLWGACQNVVDGVFDATLELLQRLALTSNNTQLLGELLNSVPIIGGLLSFGYEVATWGVETALPLFQAVDSPAVRNALACDLFCYGTGMCSVSMNGVVSVFSQAAVETPPFSTELLPNLEWVIGLLLSGDPDKEVAASICMLGVFVMQYGGQFGEMAVGVQSLQQLAAQGGIENPSSGWQATCDPCTPEWCYEYTPSTGLADWLPHSDRGIWTGTGWRRGAVDKLWIQMNSPIWLTTANIISVTVDVSIPFPPAEGHQYWSNGHVGTTPQYNSDGDGVQHEWTISSATDRIAVGIASSAQLPVTVEIQKITITGTGTPPLVSNC